MSNIGTYFEIPVTNLDRAIDFYSYVFDCEFSKETIHNCEMAFFPFDKNKEGICGGLVKGEIYKPSLEGSLVYLATDDIETTMTRATEKGAVGLFPKTLVPGMGYSAEFKDSEGNRVALFQNL